MSSPYSKFSKEDLILRDQLAIDRTILSNERTILAYTRTSLAIMAAGATLIHFFDEYFIKIFGGILITVGLLIIGIGFIRYKNMKKSINKINRA